LAFGNHRQRAQSQAHLASTDERRRILTRPTHAGIVKRQLRAQEAPTGIQTRKVHRDTQRIPRPRLNLALVTGKLRDQQTKCADTDRE